MFPPEASNPIAAGHEKCNIAEAYVKDFKMAIMNMFKRSREDINKSLKEAHENTNKQ